MKNIEILLLMRTLELSFHMYWCCCFYDSFVKAFLLFLFFGYALLRINPRMWRKIKAKKMFACVVVVGFAFIWFFISIIFYNRVFFCLIIKQQYFILYFFHFTKKLISRTYLMLLCINLTTILNHFMFFLLQTQSLNLDVPSLLNDNFMQFSFILFFPIKKSLQWKISSYFERKKEVAFWIQLS